MLQAIAEQVGTPAYVYDARAIDAGIQRWIDAVGDPARISFAAKANTNLAVLARLERFGVGAEVATPGELARARRAGFPLARIVFGGVPKSAAAIRDGIRAGVGMIVLQSEHEVDAAVLHATESPNGPVNVGLRVRPGIRAGAHPSLETGRADAKFGFSPDQIPEIWQRLCAEPDLVPRYAGVSPRVRTRRRRSVRAGAGPAPVVGSIVGAARSAGARTRCRGRAGDRLCESRGPGAEGPRPPI